MKLKSFLVISAIVALVYAVFNMCVSGNPATAPLWSVVLAVGAVLPTVIAFIAQREGLKKFVCDYLSLKNTNWRKVVLTVGFTALLLPVVKAVVVGLAGNLLGISAAGSLTTSFNAQLFGFIPYSGSTAADILPVIAADIIYLFVAGSIIGIFNCIFEEIAWRGFMAKYLNGSLVAKSVIISIVWTLWTLAMTYTHTTWLNAVMLLVLNMLLSYYLLRIAGSTGSVWACVMVRGIFSLGALSYCILPGSDSGTRLVSIIVVFVIIGIMSSVMKSRS